MRTVDLSKGGDGGNEERAIDGARAPRGALKLRGLTRSVELVPEATNGKVLRLEGGDNLGAGRVHGVASGKPRDGDLRLEREAEERREQPQLVFGEHRSSGVILHRRVVQLAHDPDPADFTCERLPLSTEGVLRVFRRGNHAATAG
jgi:hypothetical protein